MTDETTETIESEKRIIETGDVIEVVIVHPNGDQDNDPAARVGGKIAFIRFGSDYQPEFGEVVECRVADVDDGNVLLVPEDPESYT